MFIVKNGNKNKKILAYTSLVNPILEYGVACLDPYRECQIRALDRVQNEAANFAHHSGGSDWESLAQRRKAAHICAHYKAYTGESAWEGIIDRQQVPSYFSRVDHNWKIKSRKQRASGITPLRIGPLLTGTSCLKGRQRIPTVKCVFSKRGLGF
jgi:hypothetical protein